MLEESYADLRCITYLARPIVDASQRAGSANEEGALRLDAKLVAFFTRLPLERIKTP